MHVTSFNNKCVFYYITWFLRYLKFVTTCPHIVAYLRFSVPYNTYTYCVKLYKIRKTGIQWECLKKKRWGFYLLIKLSTHSMEVTKCIIPVAFLSRKTSQRSVLKIAQHTLTINMYFLMKRQVMKYIYWVRNPDVTTCHWHN